MKVNKYILRQDEYSGKKNLYGKKGTKVTLISISEPAAVVEDKTGARFPVNINDLIPAQ